MVSKYSSLERIGINQDEVPKIKRYSLRRQGNSDVLKIYFHRQPSELFAQNRKFIFEKTSKRVLVDGGRQIYKEVFEISPFVLKVVDELSALETEVVNFSTGKQKILEDLAHLRKVVDQKIEEIEKDIGKLTKSK